MIKYLYVLTSSDSDNYLEQAYLSITSLRMNMPNGFISLLIDDVTQKTLTDKRAGILKLINELKVIEIDPNLKKMARSRWLKTSMRHHVKGDLLYIDSDTIICDDLSDIEKISFDLGAVYNAHSLFNEQYNKDNLKYYDKILGFNYSTKFEKYYNGGVMFIRDTPLCYTFFSEWHSNWLKGNSIFLNDQPSLNYVNYKLNNIINELDGIWNCQIRTGGIVFLSKAKIIHYFATNNTADNPYILSDPLILQNIKDSGIISDDIVEYLKKPKSCFYIHTQLIANKKTIEIVFSRVFRIFYKFYFLKSTQVILKCLKHISYMNNKYFNKRKYTKEGAK